MKRYRQKRYEKALSELTLMSDTFASEVFKHKPCAEHLISTLLHDKTLKLQQLEVQKTLTNIWGKEVRLDIFGISTSGDVYNAEIQNDLSDASVNRAAYNGALMAMYTLKKGIRFRKTKKRKQFHVLFITNGDALGYGQRENHISYYCKENMEKVNAGADLHYYNTRIHDDSPIGRIMHDFHTKYVDDMRDAVLKKYVRYYKETPEGVRHMCEIMDKIRRDGEKSGFRKGERSGFRKGEKSGFSKGEKVGEKQERKKIVRNLYKHGMSISDIVLNTEVSEQQIRKWVLKE